MYKDKKILALITARGGSKGIPRKNIKNLGGKPLISWTVEAARKSAYLDRVILSSEDAEIIEVAKAFGCEVPFIRPVNLAQDETGSMDVILHALLEVEESYDYLLLLQPTSPFRTTQHIDAIIKECIDQGLPMVVSGCRTKKHPFFMYESDNGYLKPFFGFNPQLRRQDMSPAYEHNGALYMSNVEFIKQVKSYNVPEARLFEMTGYSNLDIDEVSDWEYADYLIEKGKL